MKLTAELSLYPLQDEYIPIIQSFISQLQAQQDLTVVGNAMSTQLCGEFDRVMSVVGDLLKASTERYGKQVLVCKFIPGELAIAD
jgi:uncharacterized protein YqgV (UPF0045/DUF77 family)